MLKRSVYCRLHQRLSEQLGEARCDGPGCNMNGRDKNCTQKLLGKSEGRMPVGRPKCRCEDNIAMAVKEIVCRASLF